MKGILVSPMSQLFCLDVLQLHSYKNQSLKFFGEQFGIHISTNFGLTLGANIITCVSIKHVQT